MTKSWSASEFLECVLASIPRGQARSRSFCDSPISCPEKSAPPLAPIETGAVRDRAIQIDPMVRHEAADSGQAPKGLLKLKSPDSRSNVEITLRAFHRFEKEIQTFTRRVGRRSFRKLQGPPASTGNGMTLILPLAEAQRGFNRLS